MIVEMLENRGSQRVYVVANSNVSYEQFTDLMSKVVDALPNLDVVLLSGDLRREVEREPTFDGLCALNWLELDPDNPIRLISPYAPLRVIPVQPTF